MSDGWRGLPPANRQPRMALRRCAPCYGREYITVSQPSKSSISRPGCPVNAVA